MSRFFAWIVLLSAIVAASSDTDGPTGDSTSDDTASDSSSFPDAKDMQSSTYNNPAPPPPSGPRYYYPYGEGARLGHIVHTPGKGKYAAMTNLINCVLDVASSAFFLAQASIEIDYAVQGCDKTPESGGYCAARILNIFGAFSWAGSFLSQAVSACAPAPNEWARCATAVQAVIGSIGFLGGGSATAQYSCGPDQIYYEKVVVNDETLEKKLNNIFYHNDEGNGRVLGKCLMDSVLATANLGQAALSIRDSTLDCPDSTEKKLCATDILQILASFQYVASFISYAVNQCSETRILDAACAGAAAQISASLTELGSKAAAMSRQCDPRVLQLQNVPPYQIAGLYGHRRLMMDAIINHTRAAREASVMV